MPPHIPEGDFSVSHDLAGAYATASEVEAWQGKLDPDEWPTIFIQAGLHALMHLADQVVLEPFRKAFFRTATEEQRMGALQEILRTAEGIPDSPVGMLMAPYLFLETDPPILSSATLYFCGLAFPTEDGDVTQGARMVLEAVAARHAAGQIMEAGILAGGLLLMGDARFRDRMDEAWQILDVDARRAMAKANSGFVTDAHMQFLLDHLEQTEDPGEFGFLAAAVARMAHAAAERGVHSIERLVPVSQNPEEPIKVLQSWDGPEYGNKILPRLEAMMAKEEEEDDDEPVMHIVVGLWRDLVLLAMPLLPRLWRKLRRSREK